MTSQPPTTGAAVRTPVTAAPVPDLDGSRAIRRALEDLALDSRERT